MVYSRDRKMQNRPIKALLMSVFFMFHSFQDNPRDIFQNCFIVTGRWHVLKHGNKIKANLILVPSVGSSSALSLPHQINFPFMIFPLQWLFISKTMILAAMWKCLEYSLMILANFYSAWSDQIGERQRWRPSLSHHQSSVITTFTTHSREQTPEIGESLRHHMSTSEQRLS